MKKTYLSKLYDLKTTALWKWITFIDYVEILSLIYFCNNFRYSIQKKKIYWAFMPEICKIMYS